MSCHIPPAFPKGTLAAGSGGNVTAACHHVRPPGPVPGRQGVSIPPSPPVGVGQSHSPTDDRPARWLADPRCLQWGMQGSGEQACVPSSPARPEGQRTRSHQSPGRTWPHPRPRVTTLERRSGSWPSAHSWSPNCSLCVLLFKDSGFCCRSSNDKSNDKSNDQIMLTVKTLKDTEESQNPASSQLPWTALLSLLVHFLPVFSKCIQKLHFTYYFITSSFLKRKTKFP